MSIENASDLNEYMSDLLDSTKPECKKFISALLQRWQDVHDDGARGDIAALPAKVWIVITVYHGTWYVFYEPLCELVKLLIFFEYEIFKHLKASDIMKLKS